jgi:uncharacterized surface protein with fasciclin (FAS1) repeats
MMARTMTIAAACLLAAACHQQDSGSKTGDGASSNRAAPAAEQGKGQPIASALSSSPGHARFAAALKAAGLEATLSGAQPYTIFAPDDSAFRKLQPGESESLLDSDNKGRLLSLLTGHIVPGLVTTDDIDRAIERGKGKAQLATVGGGVLTISRSGDGLAIAGPGGAQARIAGSEQLQSNGVIHSIDTVLMPR